MRKSLTPSYSDRILLLYVILLASLLASCQYFQPRSQTTETILCEVYGKKLLYRDVQSVIPSFESKTDSILFVKNYVNRWIKDALLIRQAELNVSQNLDVQKLVDDYRSSLLLVNYEQELYADQLDSVITHADLEEHYAAHKDDYQLQEDIVKCALFKPVVKNSESKKLWNKALSDSWDVIAEACAADEAYCFLDTAQWLSRTDLETLLPEIPASSSWMRVGDITASQIHLRIFDLAYSGEVAPMHAVNQELRRSILFERRSKLLQIKRNELYNMELDKSNVKNYVQE